MPITTSGTISVEDLADEFGGTVPHSMSEYYGKPGGIASGNPLPLSSFYGLSVSPIFQSSATVSFGSTNVASFTYPSGIQTADLLIAILGVNDNFRIQNGGPSGWSSLTGVLGAGAGEGKVWYKFAVGNESGNFSFTLPGGFISGGGTTVIRVSNVEIAPQVAVSGGNNPPSLSPSWGSDHTLWVAGLIQRYGSITGYPSGYTGATSGQGSALAWRVNEASSENPGAFSTSGSNGNASVTIGVRPRSTITSLFINYLVVAGGGGGGGAGFRYTCGGGGGSGGYIEETDVLVTAGTTYTVTVGAGAGRGNYERTAPSGGNSSISSLATATGGGGAGSRGALPTDGGSGGGGGNASTAFGTGIPGQGRDGGRGRGADQSTLAAGGGGGGANDYGFNAGNSVGGVGGDGRFSSITGSSVARAGGGGGGGYNSGSSGGTGGGGNGNSSPNTPGGSGVANTGGGGGGAGWQASISGTTTGGSGGSGVVIISSNSQATATTGSPVTSTSGGRYIYEFRSSGSITF